MMRKLPYFVSLFSVVLEVKQLRMLYQCVLCMQLKVADSEIRFCL
jgi:hypothetical protein